MDACYIIVNDKSAFFLSRLRKKSANYNLVLKRSSDLIVSIIGKLVFDNHISSFTDVHLVGVRKTVYLAGPAGRGIINIKYTCKS